MWRLLLLTLCLELSALHFHTSEPTLNKITEIISKKEKGVYLRFGDGDVVLANGQDDSYQDKNVFLQQEMREAFALNGPNVLKCLPLGCQVFSGLENGMYEGNHGSSDAWCINMVNMAAPFWNGEIGDVYSMTALAHASTSNVGLCINFLKFLKQSNCAVFVGNCNIPVHIRELLFGKECQFVPTPARNSYEEIDRIEKECLEKTANINGYKIIVTSMGCSGRALQKRLWNKLDNVFLFDFGSLMDALCGWNTRAWIDLEHFNAPAFVQTLEKELQSGIIRVVCTSALIPECYGPRKQQYIRCINLLKSYNYQPYIFEACHPSPPTFFEDHAQHVFYSNVNDNQLRNKGVNEARSMMEGFKHYQFNDNDMIVKVTGRYHLESRHFLNLVENNPEVDVFVKCDPWHPIPLGRVITGCFAMRSRLFKEMLENLDLIKMEDEMIDIEIEVARFVKKLISRGSAVMYVDHLDVSANVGIRCPVALTYW